MKVILKKVRAKTLFSIIEPIKVEPLELCYLQTVLIELDFEVFIEDDLYKIFPPQDFIPDMIVLTGYNTAEKEIILEAKKYKVKYPKCKIVVGGVHAELNATSFHKLGIDYVIHSQSLSIFKLVAQNINDKNDALLEDGVDYYDFNHKSWHIGNRCNISKKESFIANRQLFKQIRKKTKYLDKRNVALVKGGIGCPFGCTYCYCKGLNNGVYVKNDYSEMIKEMSSIRSDYYWIVDDVLFVTRQDALDFIEAIRKANLKFHIIGYLRADFIIKEKDLLPDLKKAGLSEIIIGFESPNNKELKTYEKAIDALNYPEIINLLKDNAIEFTALFMVKPDYSIMDFTKLYQFIKKEKIDIFTISIFTPIKGTKAYKEMEEDLITKDPKKYDFLHLVIKSKLPPPLFYLLFYGIHLRLLKSKRIWKYISSKFRKKEVQL